MAERVSALPQPPLNDEPIPWPHKAETADAVAQEKSGDQGKFSLDDISRRARSAWQRVQDTGDHFIARSRNRMHRLSQEHPLRVVMGVAVACLLAGAALRIWRSNHE